MHSTEFTASEEDKRKFLVILPVFENFTNKDLSVLSKHMSYIHLQKGEFLFVEGDEGTFMGFIVDGGLEVMKKSQRGENVVIANLTKGSPVGEMAFIDRSTRSATVMAQQPTTLATLTEIDFEALTRNSPALGIKFIRNIARLLSLNMRRTSSRFADLMQPEV